MITIVGLGVARGDLTLGALEALTGGGQVLLRTARTPAADVLRERGVEALICGGVGMGARQALEAAGIALYGGVTGDADAAAHALAQGRLVYDAAAQCDHHHGQEHAHHHGACAEHGCGRHGCGHAPGGDGK